MARTNPKRLRSALLRLGPRWTCLAMLVSSACLATLSQARGEEAPPDRKLPEALAMLVTILTKGADMSPGDGWFHPSESRFGYSWLAARLDADHDGTISTAEWGENDEAFFARLDRDASGAITADDFDWTEKAEHLMRRRATRRLNAMLDTDSNGRISTEEWAALYAKLAGEKGFLTGDDIGNWIAPPPTTPSAPPPGSMPSKWTLVRAFLRGEIGSFHEGPALDAEAPDFSLATHDRARTISLRELKGKKPVVLIFGSFT